MCHLQIKLYYGHFLWQYLSRWPLMNEQLVSALMVSYLIHVAGRFILVMQGNSLTRNEIKICKIAFLLVPINSHF